MATKKTIYLIRHGETDYNRRGVVQGSGIDSDLNALGLAQAQAFFDTYQNIPFSKVYTSGLKRTHQSVKNFLDAGLPWEQYPGLNEISWGSKEGRIPNNEDNEYYKELMDNWQAGNVSMQAEDGESPVDVLERQKPVIDVILSRPEEETVLVAMHGRAMRILLTYLLQRPLHEMDNFEHANLCLYKLSYNYETESFSIELENDLSHLAQLSNF
ncbi:probable phosphoglycerate mutase [Pseudarcicella hirudinis]|uniref:Probable phosphoglycerate mutase n=1 Tax=Pseudarcicella hirudinis TaxID=1079859 RepID=A0A1I5XM63_9BACT|nr:histidine phosphatase family protein [Pseudarcicella hirudinis]SFQ33062.1 probable phosphoglycerate mutase [Pseudarcicella hirudinis]